MTAPQLRLPRGASCCLAVVFSAATLLGVAEEDDCLASSGLGCGVGAQTPYFCPYKGCNLNRSGMATFQGPFDLSVPTWIWEEPNRREKGMGTTRVFHSSPMIDDEYNTYIQSTTGWVYSIDKAGSTRWEFNTRDFNPGNVALQGGVVYTINQAGTAFAIDAHTGKEVWQSKIALGAPSDTHSLLVHGDTVLTACNPDVKVRPEYLRDPSLMSHAVCALDAKDGHLRWVFDQIASSRREDALATNQMPTIVGNSTLFSDAFGGMYSVALADGALQWYADATSSLGAIAQSGGMLPFATTASMAVGPDDRLYHGFNQFGGLGKLRCQSIHDGRVLWEKHFKTELNAAPAVGTLHGLGQKLAVVVGLGLNPSPVPLGRMGRMAYRMGFLQGKDTSVLALDAGNGMLLWRFDAPAWDGTLENNDEAKDLMCAPDTWGNPAIGSDGTVYMNWSGGKVFALRDANGDGVVDGNDPKEVSAYHHGWGTNGAAAIGPGFVVAPSCKDVIAWSS